MKLRQSFLLSLTDLIFTTQNPKGSGDKTPWPISAVIGKIIYPVYCRVLCCSLQGTLLYTAGCCPVLCKVLAFTLQGACLCSTGCFPVLCRVLSSTLRGAVLCTAECCPVLCKMLSCALKNTEQISFPQTSVLLFYLPVIMTKNTSRQCWVSPVE